MARDLNKVQLTGRLGADPEMRYTAEGTAVTTFRVASNRTWNDSKGARHEDAEWFRIVAWDKLGDICNQYLTKGARVYVEGRLQTKKYTDRDGNDRYSTEVVASDMIMLDSRRDRDDEEPEPPARRPASRNQPQPIESDDDIPF